MKYLAVSGLLTATALAAIDIGNGGTNESVPLLKAAAKLVTSNLVTYYHGTEPGKTVGILPAPGTSSNTTDRYYWWESGVMWDTLISYWHSTGDEQYNDLITKGLLSQVGPSNNFMPPNWTATMGNDDQGFWAMAAMTAAETGLPNDGAQEGQGWLDLVKNVFETQAQRWNEGDSCGGGLRWQIPVINAGYDYKNSASQAVLFNIASRLARYTGNQTYADWAEKVWTWTENMGFMHDVENVGTVVYDGAHVEKNCTDINRSQWSYTAGIFLHGAASMYNQSQSSQGDVWRDRISKVYGAIGHDFFDNSSLVLFETACEGRRGNKSTCTKDMRAFKGITLRALTSLTKLASFETVSPLLLSTATGAARLCDNQTGACSFTWDNSELDESQKNGIVKDDGLRGVGEQMNALSAFLASLSVVLQDQVAAPLTANGSSNGTSTPTTSGTGTSTSATATPTPGGATITGASAGSVLGGLLLVAAFFV